MEAAGSLKVHVNAPLCDIVSDWGSLNLEIPARSTVLEMDAHEILQIPRRHGREAASQQRVKTQRPMS
jgi:hypothetical protein